MYSPLKLHIGALYGNINDFVLGHKEVWEIGLTGLELALLITELRYILPENGVTAKRITVNSVLEKHSK